MYRRTFWEALDIPYIDGDYSSIIPKELIQSHPGIQELINQFPEFIKNTTDTTSSHDLSAEQCGNLPLISFKK